MWGKQPWDNDTAADWFAKMMEETNMPAYVRKTLSIVNKNAMNEDISPILRSAAFCLIQFGYVYVWPVDQLKDDLKMGIKALNYVLTDQEYCYSEIVTSEITEELKQLEERLKEIVK